MQTIDKEPVATGKDIGLLFKPHLIKALLRDESPKTQTRRIIDPQPTLENGSWVWRRDKKANAPLIDSPLMLSKAPYKVGDRLYCKESLYLGSDHCWHYDADHETVMVAKKNEGAMIAWAHHKETESHSAIFMPKWAARIWREITEVRVQRISEISEEDAIREGIQPLEILRAIPPFKSRVRYFNYELQVPCTSQDGDAGRRSFRSLWNEINGKWTPVRKGGTLAYYICYPWDEDDIPEKPLNACRKGIPCHAYPNPWVWALNFTTEVREGGSE